MPMNRLEDLILFAEVVERSGFSAAARSLGMQRSKLSRRIAELEKRMGVRLFQRNTRRVSMTQAGELVYAHARTISDEVRQAFNVVESIGNEPRGTLRITCSATFASNALLPVVSEFRETYPFVRFSINASDNYVDLISDKVDLAFRVSSGPLDDSSLIVRTICDLPMVLAAHPRLLQGPSGLPHPKDAAGMDLLGLTLKDQEYEVWFQHSQGERFALSGTPILVCNNMSTLQEATLAGLGIAVLPGYLCQEAMRKGLLVNVLSPRSGWNPTDSSAYALMPARHGLPFTTRIFMDFSLPRLKRILTSKFDGSARAPGAHALPST